MRQYIDVVKGLMEAVVPFPTRERPAMVADPEGEVRPFKIKPVEPNRFRMIVQSATTRAGRKPHVRIVDDLDHLNAEQVATQLHNYQPVKKADNMWMSAPIQSEVGETRYFMHVLVDQRAPQERDMAEIERLMAS